MKILPPQEEYLRKTIRDALALNPLVSIRGIQDHVKYRTDRTISDKYVSKLLYKVRREVVVQSDRTALRARLVEVKERYRMLIEQLYCIVFWPIPYSDRSDNSYISHSMRMPSAAERTAAVKTIAQMEMALMKAELDIGLFEDRRTAIEDMLREGLLPPELHEEVILVFRRWKTRQTKQADASKSEPNPYRIIGP